MRISWNHNALRLQLLECDQHAISYNVKTIWIILVFKLFIVFVLDCNRTWKYTHVQDVDVYYIRLSSSPPTTTSSFVIVTKTEILFTIYGIFDICYSFRLQHFIAIEGNLTGNN